ncbi:MAG: hypothetical protein US69_C0011G0019 [candidate division TM6 bacterium GW2011_GWF2_38_10]|nr:MAG: hypothetical protein US69_C0011G0019 [candidate division TM6 bacterium GW2011_GWF2_38_10]
MENTNLAITQTHKPMLYASYQTSYSPIYDAAYDFGFIFIDEEEEAEEALEA